MRLLENVRGKKSAKTTIATAMAVGRRIGKVPVLVGVCHGFVGNRMLHQRGLQAEKLILEGAAPHQVDRVLTDFGFPMGPFAMGDLAGLDVGWRIRKGRGAKAPVADRICELGRWPKTGAGYSSTKGDRTPIPDPEVEKIIVDVATSMGITRRPIADDEILQRLLYPMVNEGAKILEEKIAIRASDIDVIWVYGYGWPVYRGARCSGPTRSGSRRCVSVCWSSRNRAATRSGRLCLARSARRRGQELHRLAAPSPP
jgi:3-hydroxyacyl-CoA dehydrogenase